ncbi:hypothetical protein BJX61DRAFT_283347 [Aspergillus egyptiacus]|nr:hypothetical protein BJX61DRAFT_283347 [Aspergillus egyptiacus]
MTEYLPRFRNHDSANCCPPAIYAPRSSPDSWKAVEKERGAGSNRRPQDSLAGDYRRCSVRPYQPLITTGAGQARLWFSSSNLQGCRLVLLLKIQSSNRSSATPDACGEGAWNGPLMCLDAGPIVPCPYLSLVRHDINRDILTSGYRELD